MIKSIRSRIKLFSVVLFVVIFHSSCSEDQPVATTLFSAIPSNQSKVDFINQLHFDQKFNIYTYRNFYNGGGVGVGDINNDGWLDIYFTSNMGDNTLYLNKGENSKQKIGFEFENITERAGIAGKRAWSTGVSMVDVNGDGWLDIYVCNSGDVEGDNKQNELFINNKDNTFTDKAEDYGLADQGYSTHAAFFDYDKDGDLDVYLLNNSFQAIGSFNLKKNERPVRNVEGGDKLFKNENGTFVDVSEQAGIYGSVIGFGLGVTVGDIDLDGWQDLFISNDFFERDYIYMNNGDGTFTEDLENQIKSISGASMGADMADINNDGYPDIFVTEMLPEPHDRLKTKTTFENWDKYQYNVGLGYYHQFTRNMLQLNTGSKQFSEIGRMAGVEATDWSWGALISDFDNDGLKDLFIANGIYKDLTDQDYINFVSTPEMAQKVISKDGVDFKTLTEVIPSNKVSNYMYRNTGKLQFENVTQDWGLSEPSHSNGSVYADLDNDGDLDLIINNVNAIASIYINNNEAFNADRNYLKLEFTGKGDNTQAIGTRLEAYCGDDVYYHEQVPVRGFESSVDPRPNFGLGKHSIIDSLKIYWNDQTQSILQNVEVNQILTLDQHSLDTRTKIKTGASDLDVTFKNVSLESGINFAHQENKFVDFDRDRLLYHMLSAEGPALCEADFNNDGQIDFYIGGASNQIGQLYLATPNGKFKSISNTTFAKDVLSEDVDCTCFDADGDGDMDLYVASGGNEFTATSSALIDRLYINDGKANFSKSNQILPSFKFQNSSTVEASDIDGDGDQDLFVGARAKPFYIGVPVDGFILINDGKGTFQDQTKIVAPELQDLGMITDASWTDIDQDGDDDLLIVGEWMGIELFENQDGTLSRKSDAYGLEKTNGWWNAIHASDLDNDGDIDFVLGNHGLNSRFTATQEKPVRLYLNDFDQNGSAESIITCYFGDESYPMALKHDLTMQLPALRKKYIKYESYQDQKIEDMFAPEILANSFVNEAYVMETSLLINNGTKGFKLKALPIEAQLSPVYGIETFDFNQDGNMDILLGGNFYYTKPEVGRYDASFGVLLEGTENGAFEHSINSNLNLDNQVRNISIHSINGSPHLFVANNNAQLQLFTIN